VDSHYLCLLARITLSRERIYSLFDTDELITMTCGTGITLTLWSAVSGTGEVFRIKRIDTGAGNLTISTRSSQTIEGETPCLPTNQSQFVTVMSDGMDSLIVEQNS
jgi:hypothetical protein